jgi:hypothetical protein
MKDKKKKAVEFGRENREIDISWRMGLEREKIFAII